MNRKSIGIEDCHPDWDGKFNDNTYNSLVELCADICNRYGLSVNNIIRHYDVTGKSCPKYYVEHNDAWEQLKQDIQNKINGDTATSVPVEPQGSDEEVKVYKNGSTPETVYSDSNCTIKLGSLNKYEQCDCFGIFNNRAMVRYQVGSTGNYKIGFVKYIPKSLQG